MNNLIVSAYFKIPSKKPHEWYVPHLRRFFRSVSCPVVFFTSLDVKTEIEQFGYDLSNIHFQVMNLNNLHAWKLGHDFWLRQKVRDVEPYHTPEVAAIWYEKKEFVKRATELFDSKAYIWCDAGCVRNDTSEDALKNFGKRLIFDDGKIHLQHIHKQEYKKFYVYPEYRFAGAIIVGNKEAWMNFITLYGKVIQEYDEEGISCNSDQYIMSSSYDRNNDLFFLHTPSVISKIEDWFFFLGIV